MCHSDTDIQTRMLFLADKTILVDKKLDVLLSKDSNNQRGIVCKSIVLFHPDMYRPRKHEVVSWLMGSNGQLDR